jgi:hypothetical protein
MAVTALVRLQEASDALAAERSDASNFTTVTKTELVQYRYYRLMGPGLATLDTVLETLFLSGMGCVVSQLLPEVDKSVKTQRQRLAAECTNLED